MIQYQQLNEVTKPLYQYLLMFQNNISIGTSTFIVPGLAMHELEQMYLRQLKEGEEAKSLFRHFIDAEQLSSQMLDYVKNFQ